MYTGVVHCTVFIPAFASTHCTYPQRDGQAELIGGWVTLEKLQFIAIPNCNPIP